MSLITFIINPNSGTGKSKRIPKLIHSYFTSQKHVYRIRYTEYAGHAKEIVNEEIAKGALTIVAVGGDGTINEIGSVLLHSQTALGIIPTGSGNGLARHLGIPMNPLKALNVIVERHTTTIDTGKLNGKPFFCTAGIGLDATVALGFSKLKGRGLFNYIIASIQAYKNFKPETVTDEEGNTYSGVLLTFCNANQYGNNAYIAPNANIRDGKFEFIEIAPVPFIQTPLFVTQLFRKKLHHNKHYTQHSFSSIKLKRTSKGAVHIDGDPLEDIDKIEVQCIPKSLVVTVPYKK